MPPSRNPFFFFFVVCLGLPTTLHAVSVEQNCHQLFRFFPKTPTELKYLVELKNSNDGLIFWTPVSGLDLYTDILVPSELLHLVERIKTKGIIGDVYFNKITIKMENVSNFHMEENDCPTRPITSFENISKPTLPLFKLSTNVWFTLSVQSKVKSLVSLSPEQKSFGREIVLNTNPSKEYALHGTHYNHTLWRFRRLDGDVGFFLLENRAFGPLALATYLSDAKGDKHLILSTDAAKKALSPHAGERAHVLWRLIPTTHTKYVKLKVKAEPHGYVTWTEDPTTLGDLKMEVDTLPSHQHKYGENGEWEKDVFWDLTPVEQISTDEGILLTYTNHPSQEKRNHGPLRDRTYYRISIKEFPNSLLTFDPSDKLVDGGAHVTLAVKSLEKYGPGGARYNDTLWKLVESEVDGYYTLENRNAPNAILTYYSNELTSLEYLQLLDNHLSLDYIRGGQNRDRALIKIIQRPEHGFYTIHLAALKGFFTWTIASNTASDFYYMHYDSKVSNAEAYIPGGHMVDHGLFSFTPVLDISDEDHHTPISYDYFYHLSLKKFPDSILTYDQDENGTYLIGMVKNRLEKYSVGGEHYGETLWRARPTEVFGSIVLENRNIQDGLVAYLNESRNLLTIAEDPVDTFQFCEGGAWRGRALVQIRRAAESGYYTLHIPSLPGFVSWTSTNIGSKELEFLHIDSNSEKFASYNSTTGSHRSDVLFSLTPVMHVDDESRILISGQYYQLSMQKYPHSLLTFTEKKSEDGHPYCQLAITGLDSFDYGAKWFLDTVWKVTHSAHAPAYYILENKGQALEKLPAALGISLAKKEKKYVELVNRNSYPDTYLLKIRPSEETGYFTIQLKYNDAYVTWNNELSGHGFHVKFEHENLPAYSQGGVWHQDALFSFLPVPKVDDDSGAIVPSTYYQISLQAYPNSLLTHTPDHFLQLSVKDIPSYSLGGWEFLNSAWRISEAENGYYIIGNKGVAGGILRVVDGPKNTKLIKLELEHEEIGRGKIGRDSVLVKVIRTSDREHYQIEFKSTPGVLTLLNTETPSGFLMQVITKREDLLHFAEGGSWRNLSLFSFDILPKVNEKSGPIVSNNYYRLRLKDDMSTPASVLSFSKSSTVSFGGRFLQSCIRNLDSYGKTGDLYNETLFQFLSTEVQDHYVIRNKGLPNSILTYLADSKVVGRAAENQARYVYLSDNAPDQLSYKSGALYRDAVLVKVERAVEVGFYTLKIRGMPNGLISKRLTKSHYGWILQVDPLHSAHYLPGGKWRDFALFSIEPAESDEPLRPNDIEKDELEPAARPALILSSGLYRISLKRIQKSLLSYDESETSFGGRYAQVVTFDNAHYATPSGELYINTLWNVTRTLEFGRTYLFENMGLEHSILTHLVKYGSSDKYLTLSTNPLHNDKYDTNQPERKSVLFNITSTPEEPGFFTIQLLAFPDLYVTWKDEKTRSGFYLQVDGTTNGIEYQPNERLRQDVLFSFEWINDEAYTKEVGVDINATEETTVADDTKQNSFTESNQERKSLEDIGSAETEQIESNIVEEVTLADTQDFQNDAEVMITRPQGSGRDESNSVITEQTPKKPLHVDLQANVYYYITLKGHPDSRLAFTPDGHIQLVTVDLTTYNTPSGTHFKHTLWIWRPTELTGYYTLENANSPDNVVTYKSGFQVKYLYLGESAIYAKGSRFRDRVLWSITSTEKRGYYTLNLRATPLGVPTWRSENTLHGYYMQLDEYPITLDNYKPTGKWRDDALFDFIPVNEADFVDESPKEGVTITQPPKKTKPGRVTQFIKEFPLAKALTLSTGVIYTISLKHFNQSVLTSSTEKSEPGKYLQLATRDYADYGPDGDSYRDSLWTIGPTEQEDVYSLYQLANGAILTYNTRIFYGKYGIVVRDPASRPAFETGGKKRDMALWDIRSSEVEGHYTIALKGLPGMILACKNEDTTGGFYMQITDSSEFRVKGPSRAKALFQFNSAPNEYRFHGKISYFKYKYPAESVWAAQSRIVHQENITHPNSLETASTVVLTHTEDRPITNRFEYAFNDDLSLLADVAVIGGIDLASNPTAQGNFTAPILKNQGIVLTNHFDYSTEITIILPARSSVNITSFYRIYAVEMPFTALLQVTTGVNRPTLSLGTDEVDIPGATVLAFMKARGITGDVVRARGNILYIKITGTLKTSFSTPITIRKEVTLFPGEVDDEETYEKGDSVPDEMLPSLVVPEDYEAIRRVDALGLYSGIYYLISLKAIPGSALTFTKNMSLEYGNFALLGTNMERLPNFLPGGPWYKYAQWRLSLSEDAEYVEMRSRNSIGLLVVSESGSSDGRFLELTRRAKHTAKYEKSGRLRKQGLWLLEKSTLFEASFQIRSRAFDDSILILDPKASTHTGQLLQIDAQARHSPSYAPNGALYEESLFTFTPANLQIHGRVINFQYDSPSDDVIKGRFMRNKPLLSNVSMQNPTGAKLSFRLQVNEAQNLKDEFIFRFDQGFPFLFDTELLTDLAIQNNPKISKKFLGGFQAHDDIQFSRAVDWSIITSLPEIVLEPYKSVNVSYYYSYVERLLVPFTAVLEMKGIVDRVAKDGKVVKGASLDNPHLLLDALQSQGVQKVTQVDGNAALVEVSGQLMTTYSLPDKAFTLYHYDPSESDDLVLVEATTTKPTIKPTTTLKTTTTPPPKPKPKTTTKEPKIKISWISA